MNESIPRTPVSSVPSAMGGFATMGVRTGALPVVKPRAQTPQEAVAPAPQGGSPDAVSLLDAGAHHGAPDAQAGGWVIGPVGGAA